MATFLLFILVFKIAKDRIGLPITVEESQLRTSLSIMLLTIFYICVICFLCCTCCTCLVYPASDTVVYCILHCVMDLGSNVYTSLFITLNKDETYIYNNNYSGNAPWQIVKRRKNTTNPSKMHHYADLLWTARNENKREARTIITFWLRGVLDKITKLIWWLLNLEEAPCNTF